MKKHALRPFPATPVVRHIFSLWNLLSFLALMAGSTVLCGLLNSMEWNDLNAVMIYILAAMLTAYMTEGYFYGFLAALLSVFLINLIFTYPYLEFNFSISGYPLTFICLFVVCLLTSMLTTKAREQERTHAEVEKEKMRSNLLRAVSHDLRTPLTSIIGSTQTVLDHGDTLTPEQKRALLQSSIDEAEWLMRMVENLLSVTRFSDGETKLHKSVEAAEELLGAAVHKFRERFSEPPVYVSTPDRLLLVNVDPLLIEQALNNLLENVVFHAVGATRIDLSLQQRGDRAVFTVADNGCGLPVTALPRLFQDFSGPSGPLHGDNSRSMGIGLRVCQAIVQAHGGTIHAANRPTGGAEFSFTLPLTEESEEIAP